MKARSACMIAYANYFTDARIKNYVETLLQSGYRVDVFALGLPEPPRDRLRVFCLMPKVWSQSIVPYVLSQIWFLVLATFLVGARHLGRRYDLIHVHNMPDFLVVAALMPKVLGARVILDVHDTMPEAYATKFDVALDHPLIRLVCLEERISAACADHVITTNDLHKKALVGHGIPAEKISIIMNVGNSAIFRPRSRRTGHESLVLAYHGTIAKRLGVDLVVRALARARESCPGVRLLLMGGGDYLAEMERLIGELRISDAVSVHGWVGVECLPELLKDADVGVIGNRAETEAKRNWMLPVKMLEYAAMEIPTIAPRLRAIQYYFDEGSAIFYEPDDVEDLARCIGEVYTDRALLDQRLEGLRRFNERYNWAEMGREYLELVARLAAREA